MNAQQIDLLLNQGKQFIAVGDLATARTVLQRAADAGVAAAALALAETYDPAVIAKLGVRGMQGDIDQARRWYERAHELGSNEAAHRLATMAPPVRSGAMRKRNGRRPPPHHGRRAMARRKHHRRSRRPGRGVQATSSSP